MIIKVTLEHIQNGVLTSCDQCPVALALIDAFKPKEIVPKVTPGAIYVFERVMAYRSITVAGKCILNINTPPMVAEFIENFDTFAYDKYAPFEFEIDYNA